MLEYQSYLFLRIFACIAAVNDKEASLRQRISEEIFLILCWKLEEPPILPRTKQTNKLDLKLTLPHPREQKSNGKKKKKGKSCGHRLTDTNLYPGCLYMWPELEKDLHVENIVWSRHINVRPRKTSPKFFFHEQKLSKQRKPGPQRNRATQRTSRKKGCKQSLDHKF